MIDVKSAKLLSEVFLDLSKAWLIGAFVTPILTGQFLNWLILTLGIFNAIVALIVARIFLEVTS